MHKDPKRHIRHFVTWGYSAATQRILFPDIALIFSSSAALCTYNCFAELPLYMPPEPIVLPSVALGLLVTFRTNTTVSRYNEARCLWGEIVNTSRDITRIALQWLPQSKDDKFGKAQAAKVCRMTKAFNIVLKYHLTIDGGNPDDRVSRTDPELPSKVKEELRKELSMVCFSPSDPVQARELEDCLSSSHRPLWTIQQMCNASHAGIWARCGDRPDRAIRDGQLLERHFQRLCGAMGACERIHRTPIPTAFTRHCSRFLVVWCAPRTPMSELDSFQGMQPISRWRLHQVQRDAVCALANRRHCDAAGGDVRGMGHVSRARVGPALPCMRPHLCRAGLAPRTLACRWRSRLTCCRSSSTARASPRRATGW